MKAIIKRPGQAPNLIEIDNTLEALQSAVGGYIEAVSLDPNTVVICNEEGVLMGLTPNVTLRGFDFVGTILILGDAGEDFCDVQNEEYWLDQLDRKDNQL